MSQLQQAKETEPQQNQNQSAEVQKKHSNKLKPIDRTSTQKKTQTIEVQPIADEVHQQNNEEPKQSEEQENLQQETSQWKQQKPEDQGFHPSQQAEDKKIDHKRYLGIIFDCYCKMTYALGKNPTFEQIEKKSHVMTMNKFMLFSKHFDIRKLLKVNQLTEIFKKNSQFYKEMYFNQFITALEKISEKIYPDKESKWDILMEYLQLHSQSAFRQKINKVCLPRYSNEKNKYKFSYTPCNGKLQEQIIFQVNKLREERKQRKQKMIKNHKENKKNKIDELYKNGVTLKKEPSQLQKLQQTRYNKSLLLQNYNEKTYQNIFQQKQGRQKYDKLGRKIIPNKKALEAAELNQIITEARKTIQKHKTQQNNEITLQNQIHLLSKSLYKNSMVTLPVPSNIFSKHDPSLGRMSQLIQQDDVDSLLEEELANERRKS